MGIHERLPVVAVFALSAWSGGCAGDGARARDKTMLDAIEAGAEHEEDETEQDAAIDPADTEPAEDDAVMPASQADADAPNMERDADAPPEEADANDPPAAMSPSVELPLALCEKYFSHTSPLPTLSAATMAFWAEENCAIAGLFGDIDASIDFLNYLRDWSLLILGCEAPREVPGGVALFGPAWLAAGAPLAQADVDALIEHFMNTLTAQLPLDMEDEARLREGLVALSAEVSLCDCPPQLDRCTGAQPSGADPDGG